MVILLRKCAKSASLELGLKKGTLCPLWKNTYSGVKRKPKRHFGLSLKMLSSARKSIITPSAAIPTAKEIKKLG